MPESGTSPLFLGGRRRGYADPSGFREERNSGAGALAGQRLLRQPDGFEAFGRLRIEPHSRHATVTNLDLPRAGTA